MKIDNYFTEKKTVLFVYPDANSAREAVYQFIKTKEHLIGKLHTLEVMDQESNHLYKFISTGSQDWVIQIAGLRLYAAHVMYDAKEFVYNFVNSRVRWHC